MPVIHLYPFVTQYCSTLIPRYLFQNKLTATPKYYTHRTYKKTYGIKTRSGAKKAIWYLTSSRTTLAMRAQTTRPELSKTFIRPLHAERYFGPTISITEKCFHTVKFRVYHQFLFLTKESTIFIHRRRRNHLKTFLWMKSGLHVSG